ncbi:MAG: DUF5719 family protein [Acidimicrobiales bacterium]
MTPRRRLVVVAVIVLVLAGGGLLDRRGRPASRVATSPPVPMAAAAAAGSSAWYCTGATAAKDGGADGNVIVANAGSRALAGVVTVYPDAGDPRRQPVAVGPRSRQVVHLADVVSSKYASALVELDGGDAVVELADGGPLGETATPCASAASTSWYFAEGVTTKDATETIFLFNPFPDDAVVDMVFGTEDGQVTPQALTGVSVRGGGMTGVNVGDFVQRREQVTAAVTARAGRLVAARLQSFDGSGPSGRKGMALLLGAAAPGDLWYLPEGLVADGVTERYQVFNPSGREARVELDLALEKGVAEPLLLTVPATGRVTVSANDEARIPKSVPHAVTARSLNGVGVVVERDMEFAAASHRSGLTESLGARVTARRWALGSGSSDDNEEEDVVVQNPGTVAAHVSLAVLSDGTDLTNDALQGLEVAPGQRRAIRLGDTVKLAVTPVVVTADQPVVVERVLASLKGAGVSASIGIPLRG